jgi:hypothetical protein
VEKTNIVGSKMPSFIEDKNITKLCCAEIERGYGF